MPPSKLPSNGNITGAYSLRYVHKLLRDGDYEIKAEPALLKAYEDFGWGEREIVAALLKLRRGHFLRSNNHKNISGLKVDHYGAEKLHLNEDVYTHFHVTNGKLVIVSFKALEENNHAQE